MSKITSNSNFNANYYQKKPYYSCSISKALPEAGRVPGRCEGLFDFRGGTEGSEIHPNFSGEALRPCLFHCDSGLERLSLKAKS